jgi:hypothetical protein
MPNAGTIVVPVGPKGATGLTGAAAVTPEPASGINGRTTAGAWVPVLPLTGGAMQGGIGWNSAAPSGPTDSSKHITFWNSSYGVSVYQSNLVFTADTQFDWYSGGNWAMSFHSNELWFSTDGWRWLYNPGNNDLLYYTYTGDNNPLFGFSQGMAQFVIWGNLYTTDKFILGQSATGIVFNNITTAVGFKFTWDGTQCFARLNNGSVIDWGLAHACDERLKTDIDLSDFDCRAALRKIRLYQYRWKKHKHIGWLKPADDDAPTIPVGFIAQRLHEDFPDGAPKTRLEPTEFKMRKAMQVQNSDPNTMMALFVGVIQELDDAITKQEQARAANRSDDHSGY